MSNKRTYCSACGGNLSRKDEAGISRDFCSKCNTFYYDNPLPVAANIVMRDREILLVKRKNPPFAGLWCLPMGFAESGESIETAALRELAEETGIQGKIVDMVDVESGDSDMYGDLLHLTFEVEWTGGDLMAGDDASALDFFPFDKLPEMAFSSNVIAIEKYIASKEEYWAILDSFCRSVGLKESSHDVSDFLSDYLVRLIEKNADVITGRWLEAVSSAKSTPSYAKFNPETSFSRHKDIIRHFSKWLGGKYSDKEFKKFFRKLGDVRRAEDFALSEVLSALSLSRKHIWEFALSQGMWNKPIDIYMALELERRVMLFFDKASYHVAKGYEKKAPLDL
ncbi:MAG: NUDIX domain-containing protein [Bacteroidota bacterium]